MELKRLNKAIAETGFCSRREADQFIEKKMVWVNEELATLGTKVGPNDTIRVKQTIVTKKPKPKHVYLAFHKPVGVICTTDLRIKDNIIDFIKFPERIFPIGRLDKPSEGLIFLTNDGDIVNKILRAKNNHEKEYIVTVDKAINRNFIRKMSQGVPILDTVTLPCKVEKLDTHTFKIILTQGLNRQIRRMSEYLGYNVTKLKRVRIMNIHLHPIKKGTFRHLKPSEIETILTMVKDSSKTAQKFDK